jgi:hypothetical protein
MSSKRGTTRTREGSGTSFAHLRGVVAAYAGLHLLQREHAINAAGPPAYERSMHQ